MYPTCGAARLPARCMPWSATRQGHGALPTRSARAFDGAGNRQPAHPHACPVCLQVVFGPAQDGGYYLLALDAPIPAGLFQVW